LAIEILVGAKAQVAAKERAVSTLEYRVPAPRKYGGAAGLSSTAGPGSDVSDDFAVVLVKAGP
jgi:hypothetical protein